MRWSVFTFERHWFGMKNQSHANRNLQYLFSIWQQVQFVSVLCVNVWNAELFQNSLATEEVEAWCQCARVCAGVFTFAYEVDFFWDEPTTKKAKTGRRNRSKQHIRLVEVVPGIQVQKRLMRVEGAIDEMQESRGDERGVKLQGSSYQGCRRRVKVWGLYVKGEEQGIRVKNRWLVVVGAKLHTNTQIKHLQ